MEKRGQIWVETVIYTLIALVLIGVVLTYVEPKIEEIQDRAIIEQSTEVLGEINSMILIISEGGAGNQRLIDLNVKEGEFKIHALLDKITFEMETKLEYSEIGEKVNVGGISIETNKLGSINNITLTLDYSGGEYDLRTDSDPLVLARSSTPYGLKIANKGGDPVVIQIGLT